MQRLLGAIDKRKLWSRTTLMIVSDHGMTPVTHSVEVQTLLSQAGLNVHVVGGDSVQHLFLQNQEDQAISSTSPANWRRKPR